MSVRVLIADDHGIVAVAQCGDDLYVLSKGAGRILQLSASRIEAVEAAEHGA